MEGRLLLDVVVRQRTSVLELLAREDQALLVGRDALLVLDLGLHVVDRVAGLDVQRDRLAREGLHEDLHGGSRFEFAIVLRNRRGLAIGTEPSLELEWLRQVLSVLLEFKEC